jgi:hypothetical protein
MWTKYEEVVSYDHPFFVDKVESYYFRFLAFIKMAIHRISNLRVKVGKTVGFCEDRYSQCMGCIPTLGSFLHHKD